MAKLEQVIKAELDPRMPVPETLAVMEAFMRLNPGHEQAILQGVAESIATLQIKMNQRGEAVDGKSVQALDRSE